MTESELQKKILDELSSIKAELMHIKEHMVDADTILSGEERQLVGEAIEAKKRGELTSLSDFKRQQGL